MKSELTDELINDIEGILSKERDLEINKINEILSNKGYKVPSSTLSRFLLRLIMRKNSLQII